LAACKNESVEGVYVGEAGTSVIILSLTELPGNALSGSIGVSVADYEKGDVIVTSKSITGSGNGQRLNLVAHGSALGDRDAPLDVDVGDGGLLTIRAPGGTEALEMQRANQATYDQRVAKLRADLTANDVGLVPED
jgi:hypothetical protein